MSDEQQKGEEPEVEGHVRHPANQEPSDEETETEDEVEAHVRRANLRMDSPRHI